MGQRPRQQPRRTTHNKTTSPTLPSFPPQQTTTMWKTTNSPPPPTTPNKIKRGNQRNHPHTQPHKTNTTQNKQNHNTTKPNLANAAQPAVLFLVVVLFVLFGVCVWFFSWFCSFLSTCYFNWCGLVWFFPRQCPLRGGLLLFLVVLGCGRKDVVEGGGLLWCWVFGICLSSYSRDSWVAYAISSSRCYSGFDVCCGCTSSFEVGPWFSAFVYSSANHACFGLGLCLLLMRGLCTLLISRMLVCCLCVVRFRMRV
jgi:hypothetical protein